MMIMCMHLQCKYEAPLPLDPGTNTTLSCFAYMGEIDDGPRHSTPRQLGFFCTTFLFYYFFGGVSQMFSITLVMRQDDGVKMCNGWWWFTPISNGALLLICGMHSCRMEIGVTSMGMIAGVIFGATFVVPLGILAAAFLFCSPIQLLLNRCFPNPPDGQERARGLSGVAKQFISRFGLGGVEEVVVVVDREIEVVRHRCEARHPQKEIFDDFAECGGSMFGDEGGGAGGGGDAPSTAMV
jgi:hypothetical protein